MAFKDHVEFFDDVIGARPVKGKGGCLAKSPEDHLYRWYQLRMLTEIRAELDSLSYNYRKMREAFDARTKRD